VVLKLLWYVVSVDVNRLVSLAHLATRVAVDSSNVYRPMRASVRLAPAVCVEPIVIDDTFSVTAGVKKVIHSVPLVIAVP
jgi:hypothetical protein